MAPLAALYACIIAFCAGLRNIDVAVKPTAYPTGCSSSNPRALFVWAPRLFPVNP